MNFEPQVIRAIQSRKKTIAFQRLRIFIVIGAMVLVTAAVVLWATVSAGKPGSQTDRGLILMAIVASVVIDAAIVAWFWRKASIRDSFQEKYPQPDELPKLAKFRNGIEGACLAVGMDPPKGNVFDVAGTCCFDFEDDDGEPAIAISSAALDAGLSTEEADVVMAQAVSRILIGDVLKRVHSEGPLVLLVAVVVECAVITFFVMLSIWGDSPVLFILISCVMLALFVGSVMVAVSVGTHLEKIQWQNLVLADSIAARITSNPVALMSALVKLQAQDLTGIVKQMGGDLNVGKDSRFWLKRLRMDAYQARMDNLAAVDAGHWSDFE
jgi:Zn-dependent protease with chaperone function